MSSRGWNKKSANNIALNRFNGSRRRKKSKLELDELVDHTFDGENFSSSDFSRTKFKNVIFNACNLNDCLFRGTELIDCIFYGGSLQCAMFEDCSLESCAFVDVDLSLAVVSSTTKLPSLYSWMQTLIFKGLTREDQMRLWREYPKEEFVEDRKAFIAMAELEYGDNL